jgi:hypothetical protein
VPAAILRVGGTKRGIRAFLGRTKMRPHRVYARGEPTSPGSTVLAKDSYFLVVVSNADGDAFPKQARDAARFLRLHLRELKSLSRFKLFAVIDFGVYDTRTKNALAPSWRLPAKLVKLLGDAGVDAEISLYSA